MSEQAVAAPVAVPAEHPSPLSPRGLRDLYLRPGQFFTRPNLTAKPVYLIAIWMMGIAAVMERVDYALIAEDSFGFKSGVALGAAHSWPMFWVIALVMGVLYGWIVWLAAGWWYWIRVGLSGAADPDPRLARAVYTYQNTVVDLPSILFTIVYTFAFTHYAASFASEQLWTWIAGIFYPWSCLTSYFGVTAAFKNVSKVKAALWFVVAPLLFYTVLAIVVGLAAAMHEA